MSVILSLLLPDLREIILAGRGRPERAARRLRVEADPRAVQQQLAVPRQARHAAVGGVAERLDCDVLVHDTYTFSRRCSRSQDEMTSW
jgi:hypothetical protein